MNDTVKHIVISVDKDGKAKTEKHGYPDGSCQHAHVWAGDIGKVSRTEKKPEFFKRIKQSISNRLRH